MSGDKSTEKPDEPLIERCSPTTFDQHHDSPSEDSDSFTFSVTDDTLDEIESIPWDNPDEARESPYKRGKELMKELKRRNTEIKTVRWFDQCVTKPKVRRQPSRKCKKMARKPVLEKCPRVVVGSFSATTTGEFTLPSTSEIYQLRDHSKPQRKIDDLVSSQTSKTASKSSKPSASSESSSTRYNTMSLKTKFDSSDKTKCSTSKVEPKSSWTTTLSDSATQRSKTMSLKSKTASTSRLKSSASGLKRKANVPGVTERTSPTASASSKCLNRRRKT